MTIQYPNTVNAAIGADAFQHGDVPAGRAVVVAFQRQHAVRVGTDHCQGADLLVVKRQYAIVFQQHHGFFCSGKGKGVVGVCIVLRVGNGVILAVVSEKPQQDAGGEQSLTGGGDLLFRHEAFLIGFQHVKVGVAAVYVTAVVNGQRGRFRGSGGDHVMGVEISNGPAVADHMPLKAPLVPKGILQQGFGAAGRLSVHPVVGTHDGFHVGFLHGGLKGRQIGFCHVLGGCLCVKLVAQLFRAGMDGEVLGTGGCLQVFAVALQATDEGHTQPGGQVRVFAVGFLSTSPARVTEDVDIGTPEGESLVNAPIFVSGLLIILSTAFRGDGFRHTLVKILVEDGSKPNGLREHGSRAGTGNAVEGFVPPVVFGDA